MAFVDLAGTFVTPSIANTPILIVDLRLWANVPQR